MSTSVEKIPKSQKTQGYSFSLLGKSRIYNPDELFQKKKKKWAE